MEKLLEEEDLEKLRAILTYHEVAGKGMSKDVVRLKKAKTVEGRDLTIKVEDERVMSDGAQVVKADLGPSNGVIHVIDSVMMPKLDRATARLPRSRVSRVWYTSEATETRPSPASWGGWGMASHRKEPSLRQLPSLLLVVFVLVFALAHFLRPFPASAIGLPVTLDGAFDDWTPAAVVHTDPSGDDGSSGIDFGTLWVASDQNYLFLRFETGVEVQGDEGQAITLYLDTDLNASTGSSVGGIGADLVWDLGGRSGTFYTPSPSSIDHADVGLQLGPTVSNTEFEIALRKDAVPAGGQPLFPLSSLRFFIQDNSAGGDRLPDSGSVGYGFTTDTFPTPSLPLEKNQPEHVRITSYNIQSDGLFDGGSREAALDRIFNAVDAEIWVINEVWNHSASEVEAKVEQFLPSGPGESWFSVGIDGGNVIVSRFPIIGSWEPLPGRRLTAALLDLRPTHDTDLLIVANHWRCCTADFERQEEADALIGFLRDARAPGGALTLAEGTPIAAAGDFNLVGLRQQFDTVITGDIQDNSTYGPDSPPDWDGGKFAFPPSRHPDARLGYTWRNDFSSFYPGMLDWIFFTESALGLENHFLLDTRTMLPSTLSQYGLLSGDSENGSDHVPRVADFRPLISTAATPPARGLELRARLLPNAPNPFNPSTQIRFELEEPATTSVSIFDAQGRLVREFAEVESPAGINALSWDGRDGMGASLGSGVYQVRLVATDETGSIELTRPVVLLE